MSLRRTSSSAMLAALILFCVDLHAADLGPTEPPMSFERAQALIRGGKGQPAMPTLESLAQQGDSRAQLLLGLSYIEGRWVPQDRIRGLAWLTIVASGYEGSSFLYDTGRKARELVPPAAAAMTGRELIEADRVANTYIRERSMAWSRSFERDRRRLRGESIESRDSLDADFRFGAGCAYDQSLNGCKTIEGGGATGHHCLDDIPVPDTPATAVGAGVWTPGVNDPTLTLPKLRGNVAVVLQVAANGRVCYAKVVDSSGDSATDQAAIDTVTRWRIIPATRNGIPVESMFSFVFRFTQ